MAQDGRQGMIRRKQVRVHGQTGHAHCIWLEPVDALVECAQPFPLIEGAVLCNLPESFKIQVKDLHFDVPARQGFGQALKARGRIGVIAAIPDDLRVDCLEEELRRLGQKQSLGGAEPLSQSGSVVLEGIPPDLRHRVVSHIAHRSSLRRRRWAPGIRPSCWQHRNREKQSAGQVPPPRPGDLAAASRR